MAPNDMVVERNEVVSVFVEFLLWGLQVLVLWLLWAWLATPIFGLHLSYLQVMGLHLILRTAIKDATFVFAPKALPTTTAIVHNLLWYGLVLLVGYLISLTY